MQPQSWINDRLPEMLWAALLIAHLPRDYALSIIREVAGYAEKFRGSKEHLDITLSGMARLDIVDTEAIVGILTSQADRRRVLRPLALLEDLPARERWCNALETPDEAEDWELLKVAVALILDHASQEATDCRWARVLFVMAAGKLLFPQEESAEVVAKEINYYPDYGDMRKVRPSVRSTEGFLGGVAEHTPTPPDFAPKFWSQCMRETTCVAEPLPVGNEMVSAGTTLERVDDIYSKLVEHAGATRNTTAVDARHDAVFGIGLYALSILKELLLIGAGNMISARMSLRTLLECFVTLAYLVKRDSDELWRAYRAFGAGQVKLAFIKLNESEGKVGYVKTESLERLANEDMWQEFLPIDLGHWEKTNLRAMSQQADVKEGYDQYYGWTSAFSHGHWGAVRDTVLQTCQNPLHRLHRIPRATRRTLEDVVPDACRLVDQVLAEVSKAYPRFDARVSL